MFSINKFTDLEFLKQFYEKHPEKALYFNAPLNVLGIERSDVNCEMVDLEILNKLDL